MQVMLQPYGKYKGFLLSDKIEFSENICAIIGKNGSGKTRLLNSLNEGHTIVMVDSGPLDTNQISLVKINDIPKTHFSSPGNTNINKSFAQSLLRIIEKHKSTNELPYLEVLHIDRGNGLPEGYEYKIKEVVNSAEETLNKSAKQITLDEMEMYVAAKNELLNAAKTYHDITGHFNLSQMTMNYYSAIEKNKYLTYINQAEGGLACFGSQELKNLIGDIDPVERFNIIISDLFRNKFKIKEANPITAAFSYIPELILNSKGESINLEDLSSGEKTIFWLALRTFESTNNIINREDSRTEVILLDEPDAHLHPQMIIDFFECLKKLNTHLNVSFILTTHSPTTVALLPNDNIYNLIEDYETGKYQAIKVKKNAAISQLLEGVTQISVSPENARQVYVENENDSSIYTEIYTLIKNRSEKLDKNISLNFITSAPQTAESELQKHITGVYGASEKVDVLIKKINGDGDCSKVIGTVKSLIDNGSSTARGIIDWDCKERSHPTEVKVFAKDLAYSIENIVYDPISIYSFLCYKRDKYPSFFFECPEDYDWQDALEDKDKLQLVVDKITFELFKRQNKRDHPFQYMNGICLLGDKEYFIPNKKENGHSFEEKVKNRFGVINSLIDKTSGRPLIYHFTTQATIGLIRSGFINKAFEEVFSLLEK